MIELFALAMLAFVGIAIAMVMGFIFLVLKMVFWAVFFPIRLLFKLVFGVVFGVVGLVLGLIGLPILIVVGGGVLIFGLIAALFALMLPLIPFVLFGLLLWAIFKRRPATV